MRSLYFECNSAFKKAYALGTGLYYNLIRKLTVNYGVFQVYR
jgi:hypothetical protein